MLSLHALGKGAIMATFYLLPSRRALGQRFGDFLSAVFPGLDWQRAAWPDLAELLGTAALSHPGVYVVFREDLADEHNPDDSLARDFGAEEGDEIIEVQSANLGVQRRQIGACIPPLTFAPLAA
jgi:hypothetical protein